MAFTVFHAFIFDFFVFFFYLHSRCAQFRQGFKWCWLAQIVCRVGKYIIRVSVYVSVVLCVCVCMREEHNAYVLSCTATHWVVTQSTTDIFDERAGNATTPHIYTRAPPSVSIYLDIDLITSILHWFPSILIRFECKWYADGLHHTVLFFSRRYISTQFSTATNIKITNEMNTEQWDNIYICAS